MPLNLVSSHFRCRALLCLPSVLQTHRRSIQFQSNFSHTCALCFSYSLFVTQGKRGQHKQHTEARNLQKFFAAEAGPGITEERTRNPLAPRQVNVVAQHDSEQRSAAQSPRKAKTPELHSIACSPIVPPRVEEPAGIAANTSASSQDTHAEKHAQYLLRLHKLAPALRSSAAAAPLPAPSQRISAPPPPQQQHTHLCGDWQLYPILEKSRASPESKTASPFVSPVAAANSAVAPSQSMLWQHTIPTPLSTEKDRDSERETQAMDLSADEPWEYTGHDAARDASYDVALVSTSTLSSSPTPSFPSPADSPPQTDYNDWLGGSTMWLARSAQNAAIANDNTCPDSDEVVHDMGTVHGRGSVRVRSSGGLESSGGGAKGKAKRSGSREDTVDALLAIDASALVFTAVSQVLFNFCVCVYVWGARRRSASARSTQHRGVYEGT